MDRHDEVYSRFSHICESAYERFIHCINATLNAPLFMQKIKYNTSSLIKFLISSYLTNNSLLGERVFRSWFENKIIIGIAKLVK